MDAKKASKIIQPKRLKDTKANFVLNVVSLGAVVFSLAATYAAYEYISQRPNRLLRNNRFSDYLRSDSYLINKSVWVGLAPPPPELQEKYYKPLESVGKHTPNE